MKIETKDGAMILICERANSAIRIERDSSDQLTITVAARDQTGNLRMESAIIPMKELEALSKPVF